MVTKTADLERRTTILRARGVPEKFIANIVRRNPTHPGIGIVFAAIAVMILTAVVVPFADSSVGILIRFLYPYAAISLVFYAPAAVALLPFFAGLLVFLGTLLAMMMSRPRHVRPAPAYEGTATGLMGLGQYETLATIKNDPSYAQLAHLADDTAFLQAVKDRPTPKGYKLLYALAFLPICLIMVSQLVELGHDKVLTRDSIVVHDLGRTATYRLADAQYAAVTCYGGPKPRFDYRLVYPTRTISLWQARDPVHHLDGAGMFAALGAVDRQLTDLNVPIHRMPMTGSPGDDARDCIETLVNRWKMSDDHLLNSLVFGQ